MKWLILPILFLISTPPAQAVVQNIRVTGSLSRLIENNNIPNGVWGSMAGRARNDETDAYNNCRDSDDGNSFQGCHELRVNGDHAVTITFVETEEVTNANPIALIRPTTTGGGTTTNNVVVARNLQITANGSGQQGTVSFTWGQICGLIRNGTAGALAQIVTTDPAGNEINECQFPDNSIANGSLQVTIGFETTPNSMDTASTTILNFYLYRPPASAGVIEPGCSTANQEDYGFCDIGVFPGDEGGTVNPPEGFVKVDGTDRINRLVRGTAITASGFDNIGNTANLPLTVEGLRLYFAPMNQRAAHPNVADAQQSTFTIDTGTTSGTNLAFVDPDFSGLENGTQYFFRGATIDSSGTVSQLFADEFCPDPVNCPDYSITPSVVAGVITESSCFITSATYGSPQAHQVKLFRDFRKNFLWTNSFGRFLSRTYNTYGPYGAKWIYQNPSSKKFVRVALYPFYGFAYLSVHFGFLVAALIYLMGPILLSLGFLKLKAGLK